MDVHMTTEEFYGDKYYLLQSAMHLLKGEVELLRNYRKQQGRPDPVEHCEGRIKSPDSMIDKLKRKGLDVTVDNALFEVHDAVGLRLVCGFVDDVYDMVELFHSMKELEIIKEKDFIANPKPNGYRSYHIIVKVPIPLPDGTVCIPCEIQLRTIAQDSWAALEHQLKYKKDVQNVDLIQQELRRCADEMASTDLTLQTVRQMIQGGGIG